MPLPDPDRPTRARFVLALWLCGMAGVLYLDRICMGQAVDPIQEELRLSNTEMGYVAMAFTLAYGLFEVPAGWLGDRVGGRWVLTAVVVWWSAFTALTGAGAGLLSLVAIRFLFGAGEAGAFPNAARVISRWFPVGERGRVQGLMLGAAQLGSVLAPPVAAYVIGAVGWRWTFAVFGAAGLVWAAGFWAWFRDDPAAHPAVNPRELAVIRAGTPPTEPGHPSVPWAAVVVNRGVIVLSLLMVLGAFYTYFFYSWFPKYLRAARGVGNIEAGWLAAVGLAGSAVGVFLGGFVADWITHRTSDPIRARRLLGAGCFLTAAACMAVGTRLDDPFALAGLLSASTFAMHLTLPNWWSVAIPQCGRHVATLFGLMNGLGVLGAMASQGFVGVFADWRKGLGYVGREQWDPVFDVYTAVLVAAAVAWLLYRHVPIELTSSPAASGPAASSPPG